MMICSPVLEIFYSDLPFDQRIEKVANLGYTHFEFWTWWDKDLNKIQESMEQHNMALTTCVTKFVSLVDPDKRNAYLEGLEQSIEAVKLLGANKLISQTGDELTHVSRERQTDTMIEGLKAASGMLEKHNVTLMIEPLNLLYDHQGYFLSRSGEAYDILKKVNSPNVKMLFDIYHQQITEGNLINNIKDYFDEIAHFHIADHPGRKEIGTGEINYPNVLATIKDLGYQGGIGIELFPENPDHDVVLKNELFFSM